MFRAAGLIIVWNHEILWQIIKNKMLKFFGSCRGISPYDAANMLQINWQDVPMNNYELLNSLRPSDAYMRQ